MNFVTRIAEAAAKSPDRVAIEHAGSSGTQTTTYRGLIGEAERWAVKLSAQNVKRGDRVAIIADNDAAWVASYFGILHIGAIAVPLDTAYRADQVAAVIRNSEAVAIISSARYSGTVQAATTDRDPRRPSIVLMSDLAAEPASTTCPPIVERTSS